MQAASIPQGLEPSGVVSSPGASLIEVSAFMTAQLKEQRDHDAKVRNEIDAQRKEAVAKLDTQREKADAERRAIEAKVEALRDDAIRTQQVTALQVRLEFLHAAKLLADEELFALEDVIADADEELDADDRVVRMVGLSARMVADAAFSRQLRRKFVA